MSWYLLLIVGSVCGMLKLQYSGVFEGVVSGIFWQAVGVCVCVSLMVIWDKMLFRLWEFWFEGLGICVERFEGVLRRQHRPRIAA